MKEHWLWPSLVIENKTENEVFTKKILEISMAGHEHRGDRGNVLESFSKEPAFNWLKEVFFSEAMNWLNSAKVDLRKIQAIELLFSSVSTYEAGEYVPPHTHSRGDIHLISIFYAQSGNEQGLHDYKFIQQNRGNSDVISSEYGNLVIQDSYAVTRNSEFKEYNSPDYFKIRPEAGQVVTFPNRLYHMTTPHAGKLPRVAVSANIRFVSKWIDYKPRANSIYKYLD